MNRPIRVLNVALTSRCDLRCAYCYAGRPRARDMSWETLRCALNHLIGSSAPEATLGFTGGEPLLAFPMLQRSVAYVEERRPPGLRVRYAVTTGGLRLTDDVVAWLGEHEVETRLSFDGVPAAQAARGAGTFDKLDRTLDRLARNHERFFLGRLHVACTVTPGSVPFLADSVAYFLAKGLERFSLAPVIRLGAGGNAPDDPAAEVDAAISAELAGQFERILALSLRHRAQTGSVPLRAFARRRGDTAGAPADRPACAVAAGGSVYVDPWGEVSACPVLAGGGSDAPSGRWREMIESMRLGPIEAADFPERLAGFPEAMRRSGVFHSKRLVASASGSCGDCRHFAACTVCPMSAAHHPAGSDPRRVDEFSCLFNQALLDARERFPVDPDLAGLLKEGGDMSGRLAAAVLGEV